MDVPPRPHRATRHESGGSGPRSNRLRRLRLERIDLYQFHAPDPKVPFAESMGALAELQRAGKMRHLGVSNVTVAQIDQARRIAPIVCGIRSAAAAASEHHQRSGVNPALQ